MFVHCPKWLFFYALFGLSIFALFVQCQLDTKIQEQCKTCNKIVDQFLKGMKKTVKGNYGGGNTHWEEKSLGKYATSETRLVEILDDGRICETSDKQCHMMLEVNEEIIEQWWFKVFAKGKISEHPLTAYLCVSRLRVCCPEGTFGTNCTPCPSGNGSPCNGHGICQGNGTRTGDGSCTCDIEYKGLTCDGCADNYYETKSIENRLECRACDVSCRDTCWDSGPLGCDECAEGYAMDTDKGCQDVDECLNATTCNAHEFCINLPGSFSCNRCPVECSSCTNMENCLTCESGYLLDSGLCQDLDECSLSDACSGSNEVCLNSSGSYSCDCREGFIREDSTCIESAAEKHPSEEL